MIFWDLSETIEFTPYIFDQESLHFHKPKKREHLFIFWVGGRESGQKTGVNIRIDWIGATNYQVKITKLVIRENWVKPGLDKAAGASLSNITSL